MISESITPNFTKYRYLGMSSLWKEFPVELMICRTLESHTRIRIPSDTGTVVYCESCGYYYEVKE